MTLIIIIIIIPSVRILSRIDKKNKLFFEYNRTDWLRFSTVFNLYHQTLYILTLVYYNKVSDRFNIIINPIEMNGFIHIGISFIIIITKRKILRKKRIKKIFRMDSIALLSTKEFYRILKQYFLYLSNLRIY